MKQELKLGYAEYKMFLNWSKHTKMLVKHFLGSVHMIQFLRPIIP